MFKTKENIIHYKKGVKYYNIAIIGVTGFVGRSILQSLIDRKFPINMLYATASKHSIGKKILYGKKNSIFVQDIKNIDFSQVDIVFFASSKLVSKRLVPKLADLGCIIIDNSSYWRMNPDIPLVVPEINGDILNKDSDYNIISNPNCSTIQMAMVLKPLQDLQKIKRVVVSTYQSVSGEGYLAIQKLFNQTDQFILKNKHLQKIDTDSSPSNDLTFNIIPEIDHIMDNGMTGEEWKMVLETQKILASDISVQATCVRVPVFIGHCEAINIEFSGPINIDDAINAMRNFPGLSIVDHMYDRKDSTYYNYKTPRTISGKDDIFVSRIRKDYTIRDGISLWCVTDNIRKGAALNAVQIAEKIIFNI